MRRRLLLLVLALAVAAGLAAPGATAASVCVDAYANVNGTEVAQATCLPPS